MEQDALVRLVKTQGEKLDRHDELLKEHEKELELMKEHNDTEFQSMKGAIDMLSTSIKSSLEEVNESNKYLREQNTQILNAIIKDSGDKFELKKLKWTKVFEICLTIFGAGGIAFLVIQWIMEIYKTR